jgi:hypothetical protein
MFNGQLLYFMAMWYMYFSQFGIFYQEKSGNPVVNAVLSTTFQCLFGANAFISLFSTHRQCTLSHYTQQHCYAFPKNHTPWRDWNPGVLFLRCLWCPLGHAGRLLQFHLNENNRNKFNVPTMLRSFLKINWTFVLCGHSPIRTEKCGFRLFTENWSRSWHQKFWKTWSHYVTKAVIAIANQF